MAPSPSMTPGIDRRHRIVGREVMGTTVILSSLSRQGKARVRSKGHTTKTNRKELFCGLKKVGTFGSTEARQQAFDVKIRGARPRRARQENVPFVFASSRVLVEVNWKLSEG